MKDFDRFDPWAFLEGDQLSQDSQLSQGGGPVSHVHETPESVGVEPTDDVKPDDARAKVAKAAKVPAEAATTKNTNPDVQPAKAAKPAKVAADPDTIAQRARELLDDTLEVVAGAERLEGRSFSRAVVVFQDPSGGLGILTRAEFLTPGEVALISRTTTPAPRQGGDA